MKYRWSIQTADAAVTRRLTDALKISPLLARCLVNRGFSNVDQAAIFLEPRLKNLADPFLLPNMRAAADRLLAARHANQSLVIFGDYDVDGVTSTALLVEVLTALGWKVHYYLPNRFDEGYGLSAEAVENCLQKFPVKLVLAVDCGSTSNAVIQNLRERGIDVLVLDHHQVSSPAPNATALVNPQLASATEPCFRELCSVGLAFKLAHALVKKLREENVSIASNFDLKNFLDLVALGTIADLVPLTGENRIFACTGLKHLTETPRSGLIALKTFARCPETISAFEVGYQLAPRLNAAGRLETAEDALRLLLSNDVGTAGTIACALDTHNRERQNLERGIASEAITAAKARFNPETDYVIVEARDSWHIGVVGIVASRVVQMFHRPTLILGGDAGQFRGSGRSIDGFDLAAGLRECSDLLVRHGGHAMAAGITVEAANVDLLRARLNEVAKAQLKPEHLQPSLRIDAEIALSDMTMENIVTLERLQPCGQSNPQIRFCIRGLSHQQPPQRMGKEQQHVKFRVTDGFRMVEAVWFNCGDAPLPKVRFDLAFTPLINEFNGRRSVQLKVVDWQAAT
ncbi:MAG: recJ [Verrucomicrobiales bacterium]|nr:recJ [Verrucomicrobiales bacterium]